MWDGHFFLFLKRKKNPTPPKKNPNPQQPPLGCLEFWCPKPFFFCFSEQRIAAGGAAGAHVPRRLWPRSPTLHRRRRCSRPTALPIVPIQLWSPSPSPRCPPCRRLRQPRAVPKAFNPISRCLRRPRRGFSPPHRRDASRRVSYGSGDGGTATTECIRPTERRTFGNAERGRCCSEEVFWVRANGAALAPLLRFSSLWE